MSEFNRLHANVQAALVGARAEYRVHDHRKFSTEIKSPQDFAAALGYPIQRITKTLLLCSQDRQVYAAAVCSVDRRLDLKSTADAIGVKRIEVASPEDLRKRTDYPRNGVSPLGLADNIMVVADRLLFNYPTVLIGGGAAAIEIELSPSDLTLISGASLKSITA